MQYPTATADRTGQSTLQPSAISENGEIVYHNSTVCFCSEYRLQNLCHCVDNVSFTGREILFPGQDLPWATGREVMENQSTLTGREILFLRQDLPWAAGREVVENQSTWEQLLAPDLSREKMKKVGAVYFMS